MKTTLKNVVMFVVIGLLFGGMLQAKKFNLDKAHAGVKFTATHLMVSDVDGRFKTFNFNVDIKNQSIDSLKGTVEVDSINTDNKKRDKHLLGPDFFDAKNFKTMMLKSTSYDKKNNNSGILTGTLSIKDVKKSVQFSVTMSDITKFKGKKIIGLKLETEINRKDFNIGASFPTAIVANLIKVTLNLEFAQ